MTEITITKYLTPHKLNDLYIKYINQEDLSDVCLIIPNSLKKYTFGLLADLLKFVITLNSKSYIKTLKINCDKDDLDPLYDQEYAYPIISLLWNTSAFIDKNHLDIKGILRDKQNNFFNEMNSLSRRKGHKYILTHTDHLPKNKGLIRLLENADGFNDNEEQITKSIKTIFTKYILILNKNTKIEFDEIIEDVGGIVYELSKNTYEWGRTDSNLVDIPSSIRGVYFRFHINNWVKLTEEFENTPLEQFFKHPVIIERCINNHQTLYYLEILVYDSGIGFIEKFNMNNNLTDLEVIKTCLMKNQTSSTSNLKSKKGIGLDRILNILNKKGFIRISTDRYCVYRDLIKDEYRPVKLNCLDELILNDWNNSNYNTNNIVKSRGSYISILYPFKSNK